jgi:hypothetical protein
MGNMPLADAGFLHRGHLDRPKDYVAIGVMQLTRNAQSIGPVKVNPNDGVKERIDFVPMRS